MKIKLIPEQEVTLVDQDGKEYSFLVKGLTRRQWNEYQDKVSQLLDKEDITEEELDATLGKYLLGMAIEDEKALKMILDGSISAYKQIVELIKDLSILGEEFQKKF